MPFSTTTCLDGYQQIKWSWVTFLMFNVKSQEIIAMPESKDRLINNDRPNQHTIDQLAIWDWQFVCPRGINRQGIYLVFTVNKLSVHLHLICLSLHQHIFKMNWLTNQPRTTFTRAGLQANWPAVRKFCPACKNMLPSCRKC